MRISEQFGTALRGLTAHKSRSVLTMLGIVIGIMSVIMMLSLGKGAEGLILGQISKSGPDALFVRPGGGDQGGGPPNLAQLQALKNDDIRALQKLPSLKYAVPVLMVSGTVTYDSQNIQLDVTGTTPDYQPLNAFEVEDGRFFEQPEVDGAASVAVIGSKVATSLFDGDDPLDKTIRINKKPFTVIGVLPERGSAFFTDQDKVIYVPISTARRELHNVDYVNFVMASAIGDVNLAADDIRATLRERHRIDNPSGDTKKDDFLVLTQIQAAQTFGAVATALTIFLSAIASISLVVGGIGIMNIMLVSVTERTREIGLRKAVGATRGDVLTQFLLEAVMLTSIGGAIGVVLGVLMSMAAAAVISRFSSDWHFVIPFDGVLLAFGVSTLVGLVFGLYPARKAARLDPIEALRYE
jgi:putative ABC transport system permease protein